MISGAAPRPGDASEASVKAAYLVPLHTRLAGRARFKSRTLYRAEALKAKVEARLRTVAGVHQVAVNTLTGTLLIEFEPDLNIAVLQPALEAALADVPLSSVRRSGEKWRAGPTAQAEPATATLQPAPATTMPAPPWHTLTVADVSARLESGLDGLSAPVASERLLTTGANILPTTGRRSDLSILLEQLLTPPVFMLGVSAAVSIATGGVLDAVVIGSVVVLNTLIGFFTERQSETIIASLTPPAAPEVQVRREGCWRPVAVATLVPGDLLALSPGCQVPADARLIQAERLSVDEAALTGESLPVEKQADLICREDAPLSERHNLVYKGTLVTGGSGIALVVGTGLNTEIGRIQAMAEAARPPETVVERQLNVMGNQLVLSSSAICSVVFLVGLWRGQSWLSMLKSSISLAVAAVPEGLPTVATTTLAIGIRHMRQHQVLARRLDAIETLGAVQVFCLDKTGTLTLNHMTVVALHVGLQRVVADEQGLRLVERAGDPLALPEFQRLLEVVTLCNETEVGGERDQRRFNGSATEVALLELALKAGLDIDTLRRQHPPLAIRHRAEDQPYMVTRHPWEGGQYLVAAKGSPEQVLERCDRYLQAGKVRRLTKVKRRTILQENERMAGAALRVLGVAYALAPVESEPSETWIWLGLVGMSDPLRPGMKSLLHQFHQAGIATAIITGDQSATAYAIAKELDLAAGRPVEMMDSISLDKMDPELLRSVIARVQVFSRVSPAHKLQIVQALQSGGQIVAMTGDGINDGPALKAADLGVAMGGGGTEVARSVADIVLEDDDLTTMVAAVRDGRTIYSNIRKAVRYLLSTNLSEITVMLAGIGLGIGQPLNPMQLLWINLATDVFPGLALALEPPEPDVLDQPPRDPTTPIISRRDLGRLGLESTVISGGALGSYAYALARYGAGPRANTHTFMTLTVAQLLHAFSSRSEQHSLLDRERLPPNPYLRVALGVSLALQSLTVFPGLRGLLGTTPLGLLDTLVIGAGAVLPLLLNETTKQLTTPGRSAPSGSTDGGSGPAEETP
ncbi:MAG: HAD-IC family P-type ATPase [Candidatus Competibacteraceae bacterium]